MNVVRGSHHSAYCFIENSYEGPGFGIGHGAPELFMKQFEAMSQDDDLVHEIFEVDMKAERESEALLLVLPAGNAAHIELGVAYGMGKKCYAVGSLEKTESLYCIFDKIFPDVESLKTWLHSKS